MAADDLKAVLLANRPALLRFLRARGAADDAEDIVQDLWLKLGGADGDVVRDPVAFLYRAADNLLLDRRRAGSRSGRRDLAWRRISSADDGERDDAPTVEEALIMREQLRSVEHRLSALGERTAAIFRRFRIEGRGQREIAAEEGISVSAVEKHLRRCYRLLASIRDRVDEDSEGAERQGIEGRTMPHGEGDPREEAIGWVIRLHDAPTAQDWEAFTAWLERDPANNLAYERIAQPDRLVGDEIGGKGSHAVDPTPPPMAANDVEAVRPPRRGRGVAVAAVAIAAGIAGVAVLVPREPPALFVTRPGEHRTVALSDGSRIDLNGDTRLTLGRNRRSAELARGEATFSIRHDPAHAFQLIAGNTVVRDVGTTFDVVRTKGSTEVSVGSGRVTVNPDHDPVELGAGESIRATDGSDSLVKRRTSARSVGAWRSGHLVFRAAPLALVAEQVTRTTGQLIDVDPALEGRSFTGVLIVGGDRAELAGRLGALLGIEIVPDARGWHWRAGGRSGI